MSGARFCALMLLGSATFVSTLEPARADVAPPVDRAALVRTIASDIGDPIAVAFDAVDDSLIVVDSAAARIEKIAADGSTSTVAGSTPGYRDGSPAQARFNAPGAVAVDASGAIVVADTGNHLIRRIADGRVTTLAPGTTFANPTDVAVAADGTIFVADTGVGIRAISLGTTTTLPLGDALLKVSHLAIWNGAGAALFFVTPDGVGRIDLSSRTITGAPQGGIEFAPASIVALNSTQFVASLPRYHALYFATAGLRYPWWRRVAGNPGNDATVAGDFKDGNADSARFSCPCGLAADASGNILVADSGNHRVRSVPAVNTKWESGQTALEPDKDVFRIGFISNSVAFRNTMWDDSIPGVIERRLAADGFHPKPGKPVELRAAWLGNDIESYDEYFENEVVPGTFDCVIWAFDYNVFNPEHNDWPYAFPPFDSANVSRWTSAIEKGVRTLADDGTRVLLTDVPFSFQLSPVEGVLFRDTYAGHASGADLLSIAQPDNGADFNQRMERMLATLHAPFVPTYDRLVTYERGPHVPLFPADDYHFSPAGSTVMGNHLSDEIERRKLCGPAPLP